MKLDINVPSLIKSLKDLDYSVFQNDLKPFNLNIVGIRSDNPTVNKFNDLVVVFWKYEGYWNIFQTQITREQTAFKELAKNNETSVAKISAAYNDYLNTSTDGFGKLGMMTSFLALNQDFLSAKNSKNMRTVNDLTKARKDDAKQIGAITELYSGYIAKLSTVEDVENGIEETEAERNARLKKAAEELEKALWQLRLKYDLIKKQELYEHELSEFKANEASNKLGIDIKKVDERVIEYLLDYDFPGNIRELKNIIERAVILCDGDTILHEHISFSGSKIKLTTNIGNTTNSFNFNNTETLDMEYHEKRLISRALNQSNNNKSKAALLLNVTWQALDRRMKKFGLE
jgi:uncharacterized protein YdbL (DUF1318 family)